jgi:hypothetical protein
VPLLFDTILLGLLIGLFAHPVLPSSADFFLY